MINKTTTFLNASAFSLQMTDDNFLKRVNADLDNALQEPTKKSTLAPISFDFGPEKKDLLAPYGPNAQCYFLNEQAREDGLEIRPAFLQRLGRHASTLEALTPEERNQTLDFLLSQSMSVEQGKGPLSGSHQWRE